MSGGYLYDGDDNQISGFQRIEADAHASSPGITTGAVASFVVPIGGEAKGLQLGLIKKRQKDIARQREQQEILQHLRDVNR